MWKSDQGQTLLELVVVIAVVIIVVSALTFATIASLRNAQFAKNQAQATKLAQQGIERVRAGRDGNLGVNNLHPSVTDWQTIWGYQIEDQCGDTNPTPPSSPTYCYFNVTPQGALNHLTAQGSVPAAAESIPPFQRVVILSDGAAFASQKKVTVIVGWTDFAGDHRSILTTILRKI